MDRGLDIVAFALYLFYLSYAETLVCYRLTNLQSTQSCSGDS